MKPSKGQNQTPIRVAFFHRKPRTLWNFSIETYFQQIREHLPAPYQPIYVEMPFESNGLWRRLANVIYCFFNKIAVVYISVGQQFQAQHKAFNSKNPRILQLGTAPNKNLEHALMKCCINAIS